MSKPTPFLTEDSGGLPLVFYGIKATTVPAATLKVTKKNGRLKVARVNAPKPVLKLGTA